MKECALCEKCMPGKYLIKLGYVNGFCNDCFKYLEDYFFKSDKEKQESESSSDSDLSSSDSDLSSSDSDSN